MNPTGNCIREEKERQNKSEMCDWHVEMLPKKGKKKISLSKL